MSSRSIIASVCVFCLLQMIPCSSAVLHAQSADSLRTVLQRANRASWTVRIRTPSDTITGRVNVSGADVISLGQTRVAIPDIRDVDRRVTDHQPVLLGAVLGGALLGIVGYHACPDGGDYNCGDTPVLLAGLGVGIGTLVGAFIGQRAAGSHWEAVWREQ